MKKKNNISSHATADAVSAIPKSNLKKKLPWTFLFIAIAVLTIWAVASQNKDFSLRDFWSFLGQLNPFWLIAALVAVLFYILFEGIALLVICRGFGYRRSLGKGYSYSAADIYFSAITPSATGGQPGSAFFMMKDGIPGAVVTVSLLLNLIMYTFAILVLAVICFLIKPSVFLNFTPFSQVLIVLGVVMQVGLATFFIILLRRASILRFLGDKGLSLLKKLHLIRRVEDKRLRLHGAMDSYENCVHSIGKNYKMMGLALIFNVLQRSCLVASTVFICFAAGEAFTDFASLWSAESMVILGSNYIPIPGAMGVADALKLDAFNDVLKCTSPANVELLSRTVSFYLCVFVCGISFLVRCLIFAFRKKAPAGREAKSEEEKN